MHKAKVIQLRQALQAAVAKVERDMGVTVKFGNCRYGAQDAKFQVEIVDDEFDGTKRTPEQVDFEKNCHKWGLSANHLGKTFISRGVRYEITGSKSRRYRYPILATNPNGKCFKFHPDCIVNNIV